jgi:hypothetical protein
VNTLFGIVIEMGGLGLEVSNNFVQGCDPYNAIIVQAASAEVRNNTVPKSGDVNYLNTSGVDWDAAPGTSGTLPIPIWADTVAVTGATNINKITSGEENFIGTGVYSVRITNGALATRDPQWPPDGISTPPTGTVLVTPPVLSGIHVRAGWLRLGV